MSSIFSKAVLNASVSIICHILTLMLSFVSRSFFIRYLSMEYLGISGLFSNIITILSFTELGIGNAMAFSLYEPLKNKNYSKLKSLLSIYKKAYFYIASSIFIIGCFVAPFINCLIKDKPNICEDIRLLFILYLINTVLSYLATYKKTLLLADQKNYVINLLNSFLQILLIFFQLTILYFFHSFIGFLVCQIIFTMINNLALSMIVNNQYSAVNKQVLVGLDKNEKIILFDNIKALSISKVSGIVSTGTDNIIISKLFGLSSVGLVSNYILIINSVNNVFYNAFTSVLAGIGSFNVDSDLSKKQRLFDELFFTVYLVYSFICTCLLVLIQPFIVTWIGKDCAVSYYIVVNLLLGVYVGGMNYPVYSFRTTHGYYKQVQYVYVLCATSNIVLSLILGYFFGIAGVFAATWISKFILTEVADSYYAYVVILKRNHFDYFVKYGIYLAVLAINVIFCLYLVDLILVQGWLGLMIKSVLCGICNILINLLVFHKNWELHSILVRILNLWRKL